MALEDLTRLGAEILVVDLDPKVLQGLEGLLQERGYLVTGLDDPARARALAAEKFFAVAVLDVDTPDPGEGFALARWFREQSPATQVLMLSERRTFDLAVDALRCGVADIVLKAPGQVDYLRKRIDAVARARRREADRARLLRDLGAAHQTFLERLLDTWRKLQDLEARARGAEASVAGEDDPVAVLVVDDDPALVRALTEAVRTRAKGHFELEVVQSGGEALDRASQRRFQLALVKATLPDLPGGMVLRTLKAQSDETVALLYTPPVAGQPGQVNVVEGSRTIPLIASYTAPAQLVERLDELAGAFRAKVRERGYLQSFRETHYDVLTRYAELKRRIEELLGRDEP